MKDFLYGLTGDIVLPFEPSYKTARQGYNRAINQYPLIINYCLENKDVSNAVIWARKHGIPLRIRSGGHNYEGYSNGDCTLIIDVSKMNNMYLMAAKNQVFTQAGVTNEQVYEYLSQKGYPFPGGTCPTVGVSGYMTGGGWGLSCRNFGLGCDSLMEVSLINYDGQLITANPSCNQELFWAVRGAGGGNFGVVVSMTFRLPPKVNQITLIEIDYPRQLTSKEQEKFIKVWQEWFKTADKRMTLISRIYHGEAEGLSMLVRGFFYGTPMEAKEILKEFLDLKGAICNIEAMPFIEAVNIIGSSYPESEKFDSASRFVPRFFNSDEITHITEIIKEPAKGSVFTGISMYALGGRVSEVSISDTAFFYRNAKYIIWMETVWEDDQYAKDNREWIRQQYPTLEEMTIGSYVNFPYEGLKDYLEEYYGCHAVRLRKIKSRYDPFNLFTFPQGIMEAGRRRYQPVYTLPKEADPALYKGIEDKHEERQQDKSREGGSGIEKKGNYRGFRYIEKQTEEK